MESITELWKNIVSLSPDRILGLTVIGALVTASGSLLAMFIKDVFLIRSFERWKARRDVKIAFRKYRDPLLLCAYELCNRLDEIIRKAPVTYLDFSLIDSQVLSMCHNSIYDPYYRRYKLISTVYRFASFLGWLELHRQKATFLDSGQLGANRKLENAIELIRSDLADGQLNNADDWERWDDVMIFREEQRAIGSCMISSNSEAGIINYADFYELFTGRSNTESSRWLHVAGNFFAGLKIESKGRDFRHIRCLRLVNHLVDLISTLDPERTIDELKQRQKNNEQNLSNHAVLEPEFKFHRVRRRSILRRTI